MNFIQTILSEVRKLSPKSGEYAVGIPKKGIQRPIPKTKGQFWSLNLQKHYATTTHFDFRICDGKVAYSWVLPKGLPENNEKRKAIRQPDHDPEYMGFEGYIEKDYGKGKVDLVKHSDTVLIILSNPTHVRFVIIDEKPIIEYHLWKPPDQDWFMKDVSPQYKDLDLEKGDYKKVPINEADKYYGGEWAFSPKIDGAHCIIMFDEYITRFYSPRESKTTTNALQYTYHLPWNLIKPIPELKDTKIRGEIFFTHNKKAMPVEKISGLLNKIPEKARLDIKKYGFSPQFYVFDIEKHKGRDVSNKPFKEKLKILKDAVNKLPTNFIIPEYVTSEEQKQKMLSDIKSGKEKLTNEGVVIINTEEKGAKAKKLKFGDEWDMYIREIEPTTKGGKKMAGYFTYSEKPNGEILGKVGSGLTDENRIDMYKNPNKFIGRVATIRGMSRTKKGSIRAPVFSHLRVDK